MESSLHVAFSRVWCDIFTPSGGIWMVAVHSWWHLDGYCQFLGHLGGCCSFLVASGWLLCYFLVASGWLLSIDGCIWMVPVHSWWHLHDCCYDLVPSAWLLLVTGGMQMVSVHSYENPDCHQCLFVANAQ